MKSPNLRTAILLNQISIFLLMGLPTYIFCFLFVYFSDLEVKWVPYLICVFLMWIYSTTPIFNPISHVSNLFYFRKNTIEFFKDYFFIKTSFFSISLLISLIGFSIIGEIDSIKEISMSTAMLILLNSYAILVCADFASASNLIRAKRGLSSKFNLLHFIHGMIGCGLLFAAIMVCFLVSQALGAIMLFSILSSILLIFDPLLKSTLSLKHRARILSASIAGFLLIAISLSVFEVSRGNVDFVFRKDFSTIISSKIFPAKETKTLAENEVVDFSSWHKWINTQESNNEDYAEAFVKLNEICPAYARLYPLVVRCEGCDREWYSIEEKDITSLSDEDRLQRLKFFFGSNSEYANMVGLIYAIYVKDIPAEVNNQIKKLSLDNKSNLQHMARTILENKGDLFESMRIYFGTNNKTCKEE